MQITRPEHVYKYLAGRISREVEEFWILALNADKMLIAGACLFRGTVDFCPFHPRDVFRFGYLHNATGILVAHNHPSGNPQPSADDIAITRQILRAAKFLQLPLVDHIILGRNSYYSFMESKTLTGETVDDFVDVDLTGAGDPAHANDF